MPLNTDSITLRNWAQVGGGASFTIGDIVFFPSVALPH
jgi:hypothetical protein